MRGGGRQLHQRAIKARAQHTSARTSVHSSAHGCSVTSDMLASDILNWLLAVCVVIVEEIDLRR